MLDAVLVHFFHIISNINKAYAAMGVKASTINNVVEIRGANPWGAPGRFHIILVKESLGY